MQYAVAANLTAFVYLHSGVYRCAVTNGAVVANTGVRVYSHIVAYTAMAANNSILANVAFLANLRASSNTAAPRTALGRFRTLVEGMQQHRNSHIGVVHTYQCGANGLLGHKVLADNDYGRLLLIDIVCVLRVSKEGDASLAAFFYLARLPHSDVLVAFYGALDYTGKFFCCKLHRLSILLVLLYLAGG